MKNIVLIGMSGAGKTTIGETLSKVLDRDFVDTDSFISKSLGTTIEEIFSIHGESYFRNLECNLIKEIYQRENIIISTGGGVILESENMVRLKENGIIILLEASVDTIVNNLESSTIVRPLLNDLDNMFRNIENLHNIREKLYLSSADLAVSVDNKTIDKIIYEILEKCVKINS